MNLAIYLALLVMLSVIVYSFGRPFFRGAPFAPTDRKTMNRMLERAQVKPGERACDIGSGDGRIVIALAKAGAYADGFEINPLLVWWSKIRIKRAGLSQKARIIRKNLWQTDFSPYDVVALFGIPYIMKDLGDKLLAELKPGARVVSNNFAFPTWEAASRQDGIILYTKR